MPRIPDKIERSCEDIFNELFYAVPSNTNLQTVDAILTKMLRGSDQKLRNELTEFLDRWQFRVEIADTILASDAEFDAEEQMPQNKLAE